MYKCKILAPNKILLIEVSGTITGIEGDNIVNEYRRTIQGINTKDYSLILEGKDAVASSFLVLPLIQKFITLCYNTPFKKFIFIGNDLQNSYASNLISSNNTLNKNIQLANNVDEALNML